MEIQLGSVSRNEVITVYSFNVESDIDEYGLTDFYVGENATPSRYLFGDYRYSEATPRGDAEPEYWKKVAPDYWMSQLGNLYSFKTNKILKPKKLDGEGHTGYCLQINGKRKYLYQHRIMAELFVPKNNINDDVVRNLDGFPNYNSLENLAWGTQKENRKDSVRHGTAYTPTDEDREIGLKKTRKPTRAINVYTGETLEFQSLNDACRYLGVQQSNACKTIVGDRDQTCGWRFEYL